MNEMKDSTISKNLALSTALVQDFDRFIKKRIDDFKEITTIPEVQQIIHSSNQNFDKLSDVQKFIEQQDSSPVVSHSFVKKDHDALSEELRSIVDFYKTVYEHNVIDEIFITNQYGANIALGVGTSDYRQDDEQWWQTAKRTGFFIGQTNFNENYQAYTIPIGLRITDPNGDFLGVLRVSLNLDDVLDNMKDGGKFLPSNKNVYIVDQSGMIVYSTAKNNFFYDQYEYYDILENEIDSFEVNDEDVTKFVSYSLSTGYREFPGFGWYVVVEQNADSVLDDFSELRNNMAVVTFVGISSAVIIGILLIYLITKPLHKITKIASHLSKGSLNYDLGSSKFSEFQIILDSFKKSSSSIKQLIEKEKELAESQARVKNERLLAMGELSSSLAHDLKNPLAVINIGLDALKKNSDNLDPRLKNEVFPRMDNAVQRISHQIDDVLNYVRVTPANLKRNSLLKLLNLAVSSISMPKNIELKLPKHDLEVYCDEEKIVIVFINLILNAAQAIGNDPGIIQISTINKNSYNIIEVQDSGSGISDNDLKQIFKPLFTTKMKGTGLGLSICKNITEQHGWQLDVKNKPTRFVILIPLGESSKNDYVKK